MIRKPNHFSSSYIGTVDSLDDQLLSLYRAKISYENKYRTRKKRVVLRGRKPKTGYDFGGNVIGGMLNATEWDIYLYDRYER